VFAGILLGLGAALSQSLSYLCSRWFVQRRGHTPVDLLILSHILMGGLSVVLLPFVWPATMPRLGVYAVALVCAALFYLLGQACLFVALGRCDASRVSPLLALKVFILALISVAFLHQTLSLPQWGAVGLSVLAVAVLNGTGGRMPRDAAVWTLLGCVAYCFSDLSIRGLMRHFEYLGLVRASLVTVCLSYIVCGSAGLVALGVLRRPAARSVASWANAAPFAVTWLVAMLLLYACFGRIGVVYGNIVQSSRGLISIGLGWLVAAAGHVVLEQRVSGGVFVQRAAAAGLMTGAIALFYLGL